MDFGSNSVLEMEVFGLKWVLHRVRVPQCRPSRLYKISTVNQLFGGKFKLHVTCQSTLGLLVCKRTEMGV